MMHVSFGHLRCKFHVLLCIIIIIVIIIIIIISWKPFKMSWKLVLVARTSHVALLPFFQISHHTHNNKTVD